MQKNAAGKMNTFLLNMIPLETSSMKEASKYNTSPRNIDIRANPEGTDDVISIATYSP